jgi:hypothetical protein
MPLSRVLPYLSPSMPLCRSSSSTGIASTSYVHSQPRVGRACPAASRMLLRLPRWQELCAEFRQSDICARRAARRQRLGRGGKREESTER